MFTVEEGRQSWAADVDKCNSTRWRHFQHFWCFDALDIFTIMPKLTDASSPVFFAKRILPFWLRMLLFRVDQGQIDNQAWWLSWPTKIINQTKLTKSIKPIWSVKMTNATELIKLIKKIMVAKMTMIKPDSLSNMIRVTKTMIKISLLKHGDALFEKLLIKPILRSICGRALGWVAGCSLCFSLRGRCSRRWTRGSLCNPQKGTATRIC